MSINPFSETDDEGSCDGFRAAHAMPVMDKRAITTDHSGLLFLHVQKSAANLTGRKEQTNADRRGTVGRGADQARKRINLAENRVAGAIPG
jgi:hypothetical protein